VYATVANDHIYNRVHRIDYNGNVDAFTSICGALDKCIYTINDQSKLIASLEDRIKILENEKSTLPG
jgi:hypothetical protein